MKEYGATDAQLQLTWPNFRRRRRAVIAEAAVTAAIGHVLGASHPGGTRSDYRKIRCAKNEPRVDNRPKCGRRQHALR